ncbi:hypothetical protein CEXT_558191 [Caerostris extrusa]|uniref:Uncharacterized protein n=1 Tax=Caerostris extrusa TaxID=172846 RepID=A0AAV4WAI1_CAEEX|nr:hypothetical protein CEXT_558191 [Caerostris extrusa]
MRDPSSPNEVQPILQCPPNRLWISPFSIQFSPKCFHLLAKSSRFNLASLTDWFAKRVPPLDSMQLFKHGILIVLFRNQGACVRFWICVHVI